MQDLRYTYWDNGAVLQRVIDRGNNPTQFDTYSYDELNRLRNVNGQEYEYDEIGNITLKPDVGFYGYTSAQPHLPVYAGDNTYTYTPRGNLETRSGPTVPAGSQTFEYTSFDLPSQIVTGSDEQVTTRLEYDAGQERVMKWTDVSRTFYAGSLYRKRTVDTPTPSTEHRYLVYVGSRQVAEMVRADGESRPHTSYALYSDRLGTVTTLSDGDSIFSRDIDAFGHTGVMEFASTGVTAGFTGHSHDRELGLIDMGGRVYDPSAGRFLSADPIMQAPTWSQGSNRYSYVYNNPTNLTDPTGFQSFNDTMSTIVGGFVGIGHVGTAVLATGAFGLGDPGVAGALGVRSLSSSSSGSRTITPRPQVAGTGPVTSEPGVMSGYDAVGQARGRFGAGEPATCGGPGEPRCGQRPFGSSPMDRIDCARRAPPVAFGQRAHVLLQRGSPAHVA